MTVVLTLSVTWILLWYPVKTKRMAIASLYQKEQASSACNSLKNNFAIIEKYYPLGGR